jgi:hypothetical protein
VPAPVAPHTERIAGAVLAALKKINHADGYFTQPAYVERYSSQNLKRTERPWLILMVGRESRAIRAGSSDYWESHLNLKIEATIDPAAEEPQTGPFTDELVSQISGDIVRVLGDVDWNALSAMLIEMNATQFHEEDPEDPEDGVVFEITVRYSTNMKDPSLALAF